MSRCDEDEASAAHFCPQPSSLYGQSGSASPTALKALFGDQLPQRVSGRGELLGVHRARARHRCRAACSRRTGSCRSARLDAPPGARRGRPPRRPPARRGGPSGTSIGRPLSRRGLTASSMTCMMRGTPAMHDHVLDHEARRAGDGVVDQLGAFGDAGHAEPRRRELDRR